jgi:hypothetical protein
MIIKLTVLIAAILQAVAAATLSIGTFEQSERAFSVFIQPAGWAFSIWGLIYTLSFIYAVYQLLPKNENALLSQTRVPAIIGFLGSIIWLYFAGTEGWLLWLTAPILAGMAIAFTYVVTATADVDTKTQFLSRDILFPYAAWTGIAAWLNMQSVLTEQGVITSAGTNLVSNGAFLIGILIFTSYYFYRSQFSLWYGGVLVWAAAGVVAANLQPTGNIVFGAITGLFGVTIAVVLLHKTITKN